MKGVDLRFCLMDASTSSAMRGSVVYRNLCTVRVIFCREQVASASSSADWGKILRWRSGPVDDWPTVIVVNGRVILVTEQVAAYLAAQALRPAGAQVGPPVMKSSRTRFGGHTQPPRVRTGSLWRSSGTSGTSCARLPEPSSGAASRAGLPRGLEASNGSQSVEAREGPSVIQGAGNR